MGIPRLAMALALVPLLLGRASAQLVLLDQFNPGLGPLVSAAFDTATDHVWIYAASGTTIDSYTRAGVFVSSIPRPGEAADDFDLDVPLTDFSLNGTALPAGTLLAINGETGGAEVYALDKTNGAQLAMLSTSFGDSHVVGGAWHSQRSTLFLVADKNAAAGTGNHIVEINPDTGAVLNDFTPGNDFSVNYGDLSIDQNGALFLISSDQSFLRVMTPDGVLVQDFPLPGGVTNVSGLGLDNGRAEAFVSSNQGPVYRVGVAGGTSTTTTTSVTVTTVISTTSTTTIGGSTTSTTTVSATTSTTSTTAPGGPCELLTGKKLLLKAKDGSAKKGIGLLSADTTVTLGAGNESADDPVLHGGTLRVVSVAGDGFDDTYQLAADRWSYKKKVGQNLGYKFRPTSPIRSVLIQPSKRIKIVANGTGLGHTLGADPQPVDVVLTVGGHCYCWRFGGDVTFKAGKKWLAQNAPAPAVCGAPAP